MTVELCENVRNSKVHPEPKEINQGLSYCILTNVLEIELRCNHFRILTNITILLDEL